MVCSTHPRGFAMTQDEIIEMAIKAKFVLHKEPSDDESQLFVCTDKDIVRFANLVATLPQRPWVGLTDDEIDKTLRVYEQDYSWISFAKAISAKLKEKNT